MISLSFGVTDKREHNEKTDKSSNSQRFALYSLQVISSLHRSTEISVPLICIIFPFRNIELEKFFHGHHLRLTSAQFLKLFISTLFLFQL